MLVCIKLIGILTTQPIEATNRVVLSSKKFQVGSKTNMLHASSRKARLRAIEQELIFHLMVQLTPS